jgi:hypothetical protein
LPLTILLLGEVLFHNIRRWERCGGNSIFNGQINNLSIARKIDDRTIDRFTDGLIAIAFGVIVGSESLSFS